MAHEGMAGQALWLSLGLGLFAGLADYLGGFLLVRRSPSAKALRYFVALGAGFMLAAAMLEMLPEAFAMNAHWAAVLVLGGYCVVYLAERTLAPHIHLPQAAGGHSEESSAGQCCEESHGHEFLTKRTSYSVLLGLATHTFFDGVAIGSGFAVSAWLGWVLFVAVFLHKIPEGFTVASVMLAGGQDKRVALNSALFLGVTTLLGVLAISLEPGWVKAGLPLSAGVTIYVAATDLVPEMNREPGIGMAMVFFSGVVLFFLLRLMAPV